MLYISLNGDPVKTAEMVFDRKQRKIILNKMDWVRNDPAYPPLP